MKNIFKYFLVGGLGLFMFQAAATAGNPIKLNKTIEQIDEGNYTIRLESYVTGESMTDITTTSKPVDLVLVLDVSGSMRNSSGTTTTHTALQSKSYSYSGYGSSTYYYLYEGKYCLVKSLQKYNDKINYCLYFDVDGHRHYLTSNGVKDTPNNVTNKNSTIYTGVLYEEKTTQPTKMDLLKEACRAFIEEIYKNSLGPDGTAGTSDDIDNRTSIVKFADDSYYPNESSLAEGNHFTGSYNRTEVVRQLKSVRDNKDNLIEGINILSTGGATASDYGMTKASYVLKDLKDKEPTRESNKVVLLFTDGEPNHGSGFSTTVATTCINKANDIKNNYGAKVYTVGVFNGLSDSTQRDVNAYMSCVSSRYENITKLPDDRQTNGGKYSPQNGIVGSGVAYYQTSNGSDLKSIFESIAHGSTTGGSTISVDATSSTIIDVVSANFTIPKDVTAQGIKVWTETCTALDADKGIGTNWSDDKNVGFLKPEIVDNELRLTGFNYTENDVWNDDHTIITKYGNWVGNRTINKVAHANGKRLVVEFNVELNPEYTGGQDMPSNDLNSGLYYKDKDGKDKYEPYPVPHVEFPSICIMKDGLKVGDSAIFEVKDGDSKLINTVVLTQKESGGVLEPCYVVIKKLSAGDYTVTETDWSWAYTSSTTSMTKKLNNLVIPDTYAGTYSSAKEYLLDKGTDLNNNNNIVGVEISDVKDANQVYCVLKDKHTGSFSSDYSNSAISVLFHFKNTPATSGKPARAEAWSHNRFKGGTATSGGTEEGKEEEEEGIDD